jgi:hypothetical protein
MQPFWYRHRERRLACGQGRIVEGAMGLHPPNFSLVRPDLAARRTGSARDLV